MSHSDPTLMYAWLIPLFPLVGFLINGLLGTRIPRVVSGTIATVAVFASFVVACVLLAHVLGAGAGQNQATVYLAPWLYYATPGTADIHSFLVNFELLIDPLSVLMMLIITGVGGLIHLYSMGYMAADKGYQRFFTYMNLFVFFMLLLVMANNMLLMFVGWEGVGLCSYLLIGFFYAKQSAADAAKKAFIVNRIGDVGVLIGMFMIFANFGTLDFITGQSGVTGILQSAPSLLLHFTPLFVTTLLLMLFFGCTGKSAQIPLYTWLPDAMEGPTPVSALIHAATMVTAGVYLVSRTHSLFELSNVAMATVAVIGIATALFAATIGLMQNDIKRVLAYSTVSQLGYMFAACGAGMFAAGMYHVMTHAFFKACLFLGSGSVIHAMEHALHAAHKPDHAGVEDKHPDPYAPDPLDAQDMRNMGGLFPRIKVTAVSMIAATLAICGIWPFAGYYSKDEILWRMWQVHGNPSSPIPANWLLWGIGALTALLTAFYMFRLVMKTFFGAPRTEAARQATGSGPLMLIPIGVLALLSFVAGWPFLPLSFDKFEAFLGGTVATPGYLPPIHDPGMESVLGIGTLIAIVLVIIYCVLRYRNSKNGELLTERQRTNGFARMVYHKYWVDEAYNYWFVKLGKRIADWLWLTFDVGIVDGIVNGVGALAAWAGRRGGRWQTGYVRSYAFSMVIGIIIVLIGCLVGLRGR